MIKSWSYKSEYFRLRTKILNSIDKSLKGGNIFFGNEIKKFEKKFLFQNKLKFGSAVGSGTEALFISLMSIGIKKNDEVITVSNTAIATVSAIISSGATPKFVDIGKDFLIDPYKIEKEINKNTKAIIVVHLYGQSCKMDKILEITKKYKLKLIEDCAQAQGAKFKNQLVGTFGDLSCFSFYPTKILGAYGDGGFIGTKNKKLFNKTRKIRFYGIDTVNKKNKFYNKYYSNIHGINSRIDEIQCSILNLKINKINSYIKKRISIAKIYDKELSKTGLTLPLKNPENEHVYHLYVVYHPKRDLILKKLNEQNIFLSIQYPYPIHKMTGYNKFTRKNLSLPITEKLSKGIFSLPVYPFLEKKKIFKIIFALKKILKNLN